MTRKKVGKQRLDKYYHLAKEHGFRARSAFKLIQLNKKFNILNNCQTLIDLCAAPGGWLQVASKEMPIDRQIIGIDLSKIAPLPGIVTLQCDITTEECRKELKRILTSNADVVLHDGAPNVGTDWEKDAYSQNELVLHSLKLATEFLKKDGIFVSKIFRSKDYSSLLWVFNQFFRSVEATKPLSSREESAEIFVVCKGFTKPDDIDASFFDPAKVFGDIKRIRSVKDMMQNKKCEGYEDFNFYKVIPFEDFLCNNELLKSLLNYSKIEIDEKYKEYFDNEFLNLINDLKLLNIYDYKKIVKKRDRFVKLIVNTEDEKLEELKKLVFVENCSESVEEINNEEWKLNKIKDDMKKLKRKAKKQDMNDKIKKLKSKVYDLPDNEFFEDKLFESNEEEVEEKNSDSEILEVNKEVEESNDDDSESFDLEENEIAAIAKMKENEDEFVLNTIDRHCHNEENLPDWYLKEEREFNARLFDDDEEIIDKKTRKKEIEALNRRKKKARRKTEKILENEDEDENDENKNDKKIMRNAFKKTKMKPLLVYPVKGKIVIPKTKRKIKLVDRRMKKEIRALKRIEKRNKRNK